MRTGPAFLSFLVALALSACTRTRDKPPAVPASSVAGATLPPAQQELVGRDEAVAELACASCHAIGAAGDSLHAEAPPFRFLSQSVEISTLGKAFAEGTVTYHPEIPDWGFDRLDLDGLIAYLETIQVRATQ